MKKILTEVEVRECNRCHKHIPGAMFHAILTFENYAEHPEDRDEINGFDGDLCQKCADRVLSVISYVVGSDKAISRKKKPAE